MHRKYTESLLIAALVPWLLLVAAVRSSSFQYRHWVITLFFTIFGSVTLLGTGDGYVHLLAVENYYSNLALDKFLDDLWKIVALQVSETRSKDVYIHVLSFIFGGVLQAPKLFFPFVATVYGYFFAGSVLLVLRDFRWSNAKYVTIAFAAIFLFVKGLDGFYTVRTWTGLWVLVYASLKYHQTKRARYMILMFVPPLIHIGWFVMAIPAWIVLTIGSRPTIYAVIFLASSVTTVMPIQDAEQVLSNTERGALQVEAYRVEEKKTALRDFEQMQGKTNWYNAYRKAGLQRWAPTILILTLLFSGIYQKRMNSYQKKIFSIGLLMMALSNATWFSFALHNRSLTAAAIFLLAAFLMARLDHETKQRFVGLPSFYRWGLHLSILGFIPLIIFNISVLADRLSIFVLGLPVLVWLDPEINMSLKQVLKALLGRG